MIEIQQELGEDSTVVVAGHVVVLTTGESSSLSLVHVHDVETDLGLSIFSLHVIS